MDPFLYDSLTFSYKNSGSFVGSFNLRSVKTFGISRGKVQSVKSDFTGGVMKIQAEVFFPKLFSTGNYKSNITLNSLKLDSKGQYNLTMKDVKTKLRIKGKLVKEDDGEFYMRVSRFDIIPEPNDIHISVSGLFPDENLSKLKHFCDEFFVLKNELSAKAANEFINQSWRTYYKEMIPETRKQWEPLMMDFTNKFFAHVPFRRLHIEE